MFVMQSNGDIDEMFDERTGKKPKKYTVSKDEFGNKRMSVPLVMMDDDEPHRSSPPLTGEARKRAAYDAYCDRIRNAWKGDDQSNGTVTTRINGVENFVSRSGRDR